jgi:hypothetical protein
VSSDGTTGAIIGKDDKFKLTKNGNLRKINRNKKDGSLGLGRRAVLGILENPEKIKEMNLEEGKYHKLWPTPSKGMHKQDVNDDGRYAKWVEEKGHQVMLPAAVKLEDRKTWPTPLSRDHKDLAVNPTWKESLQTNLPREVNKEENKMWPTPNASDNRDRGNLSDPSVQRRIKIGKQVGLTTAVKEHKGGGTLNPTWVEWLMGYPSGWTDLNVSETVSSPTSPTTSDAASSNRIMWPTPMARSHLMPRKPETMAKTGRNPLTNTLEDAVQHREMWRTPDAHCDRGPSSEKRMKMKLEKKMPISLNDQVKHPNLMWPTPRANNIVNKRERLTPEGRLSKDGKQKFGLNLQDAVTMWPTPIASGARRSEGAIKQMRKKVDAGEITKEEAEKMLGGSLNPKRMKPWTPKNGRK